MKCRPLSKLVWAVLHQKRLSSEPLLKKGRVHKAHKGDIISTIVSVNRCQARLRWRVSQWEKQNGRTHSLWYHPRGDTCCHLLWQISNRADGFYRWLHFIAWRIHADWRSRCLCMCSVFTAHLLVSETSTSPSANHQMINHTHWKLQLQFPNLLHLHYNNWFWHKLDG